MFNLNGEHSSVKEDQ